MVHIRELSRHKIYLEFFGQGKKNMKYLMEIGELKRSVAQLSRTLRDLSEQVEDQQRHIHTEDRRLTSLRREFSAYQAQTHVEHRERNWSELVLRLLEHLSLLQVIIEMTHAQSYDKEVLVRGRSQTTLTRF